MRDRGGGTFLAALTKRFYDHHVRKSFSVTLRACPNGRDLARAWNVWAPKNDRTFSQVVEPDGAIVNEPGRA